MRILVVGATGVIGGAVADALAARVSSSRPGSLGGGFASACASGDEIAGGHRVALSRPKDLADLLVGYA